MSQAFLFYYDGQIIEGEEIVLHEDEAKHIVQVLRKNVGDIIQITNGVGYSAVGTISIAQKKKCHVLINKVQEHDRLEPKLHLAVAFTKNNSRNEWVLEKATELGVHTIIPLQAARSERNKFRFDRWEGIIRSATMQSQQYYLPRLTESKTITNIIEEYSEVSQKLVAHCMNDVERIGISEIEKQKETLLLIGPEGDFTIDEVKQLTSTMFRGIALGTNRLRTETAAITACAYFNMINHA